jgi:glycosyltransferase involved in cell wall biosynthesis
MNDDRRSPRQSGDRQSQAAGVIMSGPRKLLVLETDYTLEGIREREIEHSILCRDLGGYFAHVWSVHPFASLVTSRGWTPKFGAPVEHRLAPRHTFIEGKVGRFATLEHLFPLNFLLGQATLFLRLRKLIRRERISVIRAASPLYTGLLGLALARSTGIPLVVRVGGNHDKFIETTGRPLEPRLWRSRRLEKIVERFVFRRADLVAGANQDNLNFALANGARLERATLFRYGNLVDARHFTDPKARGDGTKVLEQLGVERDKFLLYVGRLEPIKQPDHVLQVLRTLRREGFGVKAILAGEGRMHDALMARAHELGVADAMLLPGNLSQSALAHLYPAAAAVISPHTGRALSEAALGAAPIVAYDVDWQGEIVETGATGILVPHGDLEGLAKGAAQLLADPGHAKQLGRNIRERALELLGQEALDRHERRQYSLLFQRIGSPGEALERPGI